MPRWVIHEKKLNFLKKKALEKQEQIIVFTIGSFHARDTGVRRYRWLIVRSVPFKILQDKGISQCRKRSYPLNFLSSPTFCQLKGASHHWLEPRNGSR